MCSHQSPQSATDPGDTVSPERQALAFLKAEALNKQSRFTHCPRSRFTSSSRRQRLDVRSRGQEK